MESCGCKHAACRATGLAYAHDRLQEDRQVHMKTGPARRVTHTPLRWYQRREQQTGSEGAPHLLAHGDNGRVSEGQAVSTAENEGEVIVGERDQRQGEQGTDLAVMRREAD
jgi:hypothetical protein